MQEVLIRGARPEDLDRIAEIEAICFPPAEAAARESIEARLAAFPESFLVAELDGTMVGFINGCVTDSPVIHDELFHSTAYHKPEGRNQTIFGLDTLPEYRGRGIAAKLMRALIERAKAAGRKSLILTCKEHLVHYYETFGYVNDGVSASTHGGARWYDMTLSLEQKTE